VKSGVFVRGCGDGQPVGFLGIVLVPAVRYGPGVAGDLHEDAIDDEVRGALLAFHLLGADERALATVGGAAREGCLRAWQQISVLEAESRARVLAAWQAEASSGVPASLAHLHPSWIEEALAGEPPGLAAALRSVLGGSRPSLEPALRPVVRSAFGHLFPLCEGAIGLEAKRLCALEPEELVREVTRRGARTLGRSLAGAAPDLCARAMAATGEPWAREVAAGAREALSREARRAAVKLASQHGPSSGRAPEEQLRAIGLAALGAELARESPASRRRVAGRLPAPLGRTLAGW
jgi:hypothetical protein